MRRLLLFIVLLFIGLTSFGQLVKRKVYITVDSLKTSSVDTFLLYSKSCTGCSYTDTCSKEPSIFLFYRKGGFTFVKKYSYCRQSETVQVTNPDPLNYYIQHSSSINLEEIKRPSYYQNIKKKKPPELLTVYSEHSFFHNLTFIIEGQVMTKSVDTFDLETETLSGGKRNIFFNRNQNTKVKSLIDIVSKVVRDTKLPVP
jgi:hypothetical protein